MRTPLSPELLDSLRKDLDADIKSRQAAAAKLRNNAAEWAFDQEGSRLIQKAILQVPTERKAMLQKFKGGIFQKAVNDKFAVFVIIEALQREGLLSFIVDELLKEGIVNIVITALGCKMWCKGVMLPVHLATPEMGRLLADFARGIDDPTKITNKNILHCLKYIFQNNDIKADAKKNVYMVVKKHAFAVAKIKQGSYAIEAAFHNWTRDSEMILDGLLYQMGMDSDATRDKKAIELAKDEFGIYVIRAILGWHKCEKPCKRRQDSAKSVAEAVLNNLGELEASKNFQEDQGKQKKGEAIGPEVVALAKDIRHAAQNNSTTPAPTRVFFSQRGPP